MQRPANQIVNQMIVVTDPILDIKSIATNSCLSKRTVHKILRSPNGPEYFKLNGKCLIQWSKWTQYLERRFKVKRDLDKIVDEVVEGLKK